MSNRLTKSDHHVTDPPPIGVAHQGILAVSGSVRAGSVNTAVLRAAAVAAPAEVAVALDDSVRHLPAYDPDLEASPPGVAARFRAACEAARGVLLSVPEYAWGIPGAFKNALDWTVRSGSLHRKAVTVIDISAPGRRRRLRAALGDVLAALEADVVWASVPISDADRDIHGAVAAPVVLTQLRMIVEELAIRTERNTA